MQDNQSSTQPQILIDQYRKRKADGKVRFVRDEATGGILIEQQIFNIHGDPLTVWKLPTNQKHLQKIRIDLQAQIEGAGLERELFLDAHTKRTAQLSTNLEELDAMIIDVAEVERDKG